MKKLTAVLLLLIVMSKLAAQVNLQTGSAVFSLPIFNWQDDKSRLNSVVALSYNSGNGLKVNDVASNVGQGWNLVAGGVITRMQVGEPDDQPAFNGSITGNTTTEGNDQDFTKIAPGYLYTSIPVSQGCPIALTQYPIYKSKNQIYIQNNSVGSDKQLDYFSFQFNGKSGMFVLDAANGIGQSLGDSKMKISFQKGSIPGNYYTSGTRTTITSFTIQDIDGLSYVFSVPGKTQVLKTDYCSANLYPQTQPKFNSKSVYYQNSHEDASILNPFVTDSWYLSEIDDPLTSRKIIFTYSNTGASPVRSINTAGADITYYSNSDYVMVSYKTSKTTTPDITSITCPDGHVISFNYLTTPRADLNNTYALSSIDLQYNSRYLSKYLINTSYFILNGYGTPVAQTQKTVARLCLRSVQKIGIDLKEDTPPYKFDYYTGSDNPDDIIPPPFSYAKDIWGYYNGNNSKTNKINDPNNPDESIPLNLNISQLSYDQLKGLCHFSNNSAVSLLNAKPGYAKNGLLKQIIYPTGGTLSYQYTQNTGAFDVPNVTSTIQTVGGVHVSQTSSTDGGFSNGCANPITTQYNYVLSGTSNSSMWGLEAPNNVMKVNSHYAKDKHGLKFPPLGCKWKYVYPGILSLNDAVDLKGMQSLLASIGPFLDVVGVVGDVIDVVNLVCYSSGFLAWAAVIVDVVGIIIDIFTTCDRGTKEIEQYLYYTTNLNEVSPLPTQFKRVEVTESPGTIGKTVYEFTSSDEYAIWQLKNLNYANEQRFAPWAYGLPKRTIVYDANGNLVKLDSSVYNFGANNYAGLNRIDLNLASYKCTVKRSSAQRADYWSDPSRYNDPVSGFATSDPLSGDLGVTYYSMSTGRTLLDTTYEKVYKQNSSSQYDLTTTGYYYNTGNYEVAQSYTIQSNGDVIRKYFNYSNNYSSGVYATLATTNNIALPVETITNIYRASNGGGGIPNSMNAPAGKNTTNAVLSDTSGGSAHTDGSGTNFQGSLTHKITEYGKVTNGDIKPARIYEERFTQPGTIVYYNPASPSAAYKTTQTFSYSNDISSNLIGLQDEGNRSVTNIYDYNDKYIVASVINANAATDKCAYTSFETNNVFGGWTLTGSGTYATTSAITGMQSYTLTSGSKLSVSPNTAKAYILSFWAASNSITVTGGSLKKSGPAYNGFTYYEYSVPQNTASVAVAGTVAIDELRLYPANARMRTTTFDPLIGKTSECDENNRITYYEYDNLGRLQFVKDETKNALKMYEYNNISLTKQTGCPTAATYYSHAVSEIFIKSNCSAGYLPDSSTYNLSAGAYTSTFSQADADEKAEADVLTYAQAYADSHGNCRFIYYNTKLSASDATQSCDEGQVPGTVTNPYLVPAGRYSSIISQADADRQAAEDTAANAQAYANNTAPSCAITTAPDWTYYDGDPINCQQVSGTTHEFVLMTDLNPNSSTYNWTQYVDIGTPVDACPINPTATMTGTTYFSQSNTASGGYIYAPANYVVTVTISASGPASYTHSLAANIIFGSATINQSVTNGTLQFTFIMPASGSVNWGGSFTENDNSGSGYISVQ